MLAWSLRFVAALAVWFAAMPLHAEQRNAQKGDVLRTGSDSKRLSFVDGGSLTAGPQTQLSVDQWTYDRASGMGDLIINVPQGSIRYVGGEIGRSNPIVIGTPAATLTLRGGAAIVSVTPSSTIAILTGPGDMKVVADGRTEAVSRIGWQVTTLTGAAPGVPVPTPPGALLPEIARLDAADGQAGLDQASLTPLLSPLR
jgi:hypothetical protein